MRKKQPAGDQAAPASRMSRPPWRGRWQDRRSQAGSGGRADGARCGRPDRAPPCLRGRGEGAGCRPWPDSISTPGPPCPRSRPVSTSSLVSRLMRPLTETSHGAALK